MRRERMRSSSPDTVYGPRSRISSHAELRTEAGGSTILTSAYLSAIGEYSATVCRPVVKNARRPRVFARRPAAATESSQAQPSASGRPLQPGRARRSSGTPTAPQAATADDEMVVANGWVASTTAQIQRSARKGANPIGPPKPPILTSPTGSAGLLTRPARDETTGNPASTASAARSLA